MSKSLWSRKAELERELRTLEHQDYLNKHADNFYYASGRKRNMDIRIAKIEEEIRWLGDMLIEKSE